VIVMVDMRYSAAGLQSAAAAHSELAAGIEPVAVQLGRLILDSAALGRLPAAAAFAAALERARLECSCALAAESGARTEQGRRTTATAALAAQLTDTTTNTASSATPGPHFTPGSILTGMG
jgi:hypothetical protein